MINYILTHLKVMARVGGLPLASDVGNITLESEMLRLVVNDICAICFDVAVITQTLF